MKKIIMSKNSTKQCSLATQTEKLLNQQIAMEAKASSAYLAMASWADIKGYEHAAKFLYDHSNEEREHMFKIFHYVNEVGGHALSPQINDIKIEFDSLKSIFDLVLTQEINVTKAIHELVDHTLDIKDHATFNFLQWFVLEQREEEKVARRIIELFNIIGEKGVGLYMIDQEIGKVK